MPPPPDLRRRLTVGNLMVAVAVIALTFGAATELQNRQGRDRHAAAEAVARRAAEWHREEAAACDRALAANSPYPIKQRNQERRRLARRAGLEPDDRSFRGWSNERDWHRYRLEQMTPLAEDHAARKREFQGRLLVPF